jgi:DNA polymerase-1
MIGIFDLETNGFLESVDRIHCLVIKNYETKEVLRFRSDDLINSIEAGLSVLASCSVIAGHNVIAYDLPVIHKLYPEFKTDAIIRDTLLMGKIIFADIKEHDMKLFKRGKLDGKLIGRHSLKAWGYRLNVLKGTFGETADWSTITNEMVDYCALDVEVTSALFSRMEKEGYLDSVIDMEQELHEICLKQTENGINFNENKAQELEGKLLIRKQLIQRDLKERFTSGWYVDLGIKIPTRNVSYKDVLRGNEVVGGEYHKVKWIDFNPNSRSHLGKILVDYCKWTPTEFGKDGVATINEETLKTVKDKEVVKLLEEYLTIEKRLGQLSSGQQAWMSLVKEGKIHGRIDTVGAVTMRATHSGPNLAQIPSNNSPYGKECRELFEPEKGWKIFGSDASGLELRMLAHYLSNYDKGAYGKVILEGDIHTVNQEAAGLPTRNDAKTFN